jgi:L-iditol 2-dehydrogenase
VKVVHLTARRQLTIAEVPQPTLQRPDAVLLRMARVGICGSDVHYYRDGRIGDQIVEYPSSVGHECAGTVVEVGAAVSTLAPGDRVAIDPAIVCGTCDQCRAGRSNTCRRLQFMGSPGEAPGALAQYCTVPAANCFAIPPSMSWDVAVLVEPLSIGLYAVRLSQAEPGARIAIFGAGPIGLSVLLSAKATMPCTVWMTDLLDERLAVARRCGADATTNARQEGSLETETMARQEPQWFDRVFECSGDAACIDQAQRLLSPGGRLMLVGIPPQEQVHFNPHRMRRAELTFQSVRRQKDSVAPMIRLLDQGLIDPRPMLTHCYPLSQVGAAFELVAGYRDGVVKAVVEVGS